MFKKALAIPNVDGSAESFPILTESASQTPLKSDSSAFLFGVLSDSEDSEEEASSSFVSFIFAPLTFVMRLSPLNIYVVSLLSPLSVMTLSPSIIHVPVSSFRPSKSIQYAPPSFRFSTTDIPKIFPYHVPTGVPFFFGVSVCVGAWGSAFAETAGATTPATMLATMLAATIAIIHFWTALFLFFLVALWFTSVFLSISSPPLLQRLPSRKIRWHISYIHS